MKILPPDIINTQTGDYRLTRIGLKEPILGKKLTSAVCFTAVRPQNGNCWYIVHLPLVEEMQGTYAMDGNGFQIKYRR